MLELVHTLVGAQLGHLDSQGGVATLFVTMAMPPTSPSDLKIGHMQRTPVMTLF